MYSVVAVYGVIFGVLHLTLSDVFRRHMARVEATVLQYFW